MVQLPEQSKFSMQMQTSKIKTQIRKIEKQKGKMFTELGKEAYQRHLDDKLEDSGLESTCQQIREMDVNIGQLQLQIQSIIEQSQRQYDFEQLTRKCPYCGFAISEKAGFCRSCGMTLEGAQPEAAPVHASGNSCTGCGAPLSPSAKFCRECGATQAGEEAQAEPGATESAPIKNAEFIPPPPTAQQEPSVDVSGIVPDEPKNVSPAPVETGPVQEAPAKCPNCGAEIEEEDAVFCTECGKTL